jgi:hypothetical protein
VPFRVFASAAIIEAQMGSDAGFAKSAHRAVFNYTPREGYLYVRSRAISSRCNDNFDMFPAEEIEKSYLTFIGKPVFVNHHNEDHRRSRGVIIDAALHKDRNPDGSPDTWAEVLMEVDAVRFPRLAKAILAGEVDRTSMGCDVQLSKCSVCGNEATSPLQYCAHIPGKKGKKVYKIDPRTGAKSAQLVFEICSGLSFFENSLLVEAPADPTAFFLGKVEVGPGLEHLTAGLNKTASSNERDDHDRFVSDHPWAAMDPEETEQFHRFNLSQDGPGHKPHYRNFDDLIDRHGDEYGELDNEGYKEYRAHRDHYDREPEKSFGEFKPEHWLAPSEQRSFRSMNSKTASSRVWSLLREAAAPVVERGQDYRLIGEDEARGDSRPVSEDEFHQIAQRGRSRYRSMTNNKQTTQGLNDHWDDIKHHAYQATREPWGGATYNTRTGQPIKSDADIYAMTVRPTGEHHPISVPLDAPEHEFHAAMDHARDKWGEHLANRGHHLGVFHDVDEKRIDIDPVVLLDNKKQVEEIGAYKGSVGGAYHFKSGNGFWPPHVQGFRSHSNRKTAATEPFNPHGYAWTKEGDVPQTNKIWSLLHEAAVSGDDLYDWDFIRKDASIHPGSGDGFGEEWIKQNPFHPKHIVDLYNSAVDKKYVKDKLDDNQHRPDGTLEHGQLWFPAMKHIGHALAANSHPSVGMDEHGHHSQTLAQNRTIGIMAAHSPQNEVSHDWHLASLVTATGKPIGPTGTKTGLDEKTRLTEFHRNKDGSVANPFTNAAVANNVSKILHPSTHHFNTILTTPKVGNFANLGLHGGDEPGTTYSLGQIEKGANGRIVGDTHLVGAASGKAISGATYGALGLDSAPSSKKDPLAHEHGPYGVDGNFAHSLLGDSVRVAALHLSQVHGHTIAPHEAFATAWSMRQHYTNQGIHQNPKVHSTWKKSDEDMWGHIVNLKHSWLNNDSDAEALPNKSPRPAADKGNPLKLEDHLDRNPAVGQPVRDFFHEKNLDPRGHYGRPRTVLKLNGSKLAYGETKSPEDVDTLRSENCTVCGNSSAWDGTQCQVCGYVAPPRPFGDPNTDIAQQKDIRKQVLDGNEADPNDPNQQLGQQLGNPEEVEDQEGAAAAGEDTSLGTLTCNVCGTGVQPAPPTSEGDGEPPYPADGDICPVCKKGQLLGAEDGMGEGNPGDEAEMDSADAEEGQEGGAPGGANQQQLEGDDGDEEANEESKGQQDGSDDDDQDDGDSFDPKKKADKNQKASAFVPVWWKPSWWRS